MSGYQTAFAAWCVGLVLLSASAMACELSEPEIGTVASIIDGETLKLVDGRVVRLIGAKAPMPPLGFRGEDPWPLVEEAKEARTRLAGGKQKADRASLWRGQNRPPRLCAGASLRG